MSLHPEMIENIRKFFSRRIRKHRLRKMVQNLREMLTSPSSCWNLSKRNSATGGNETGLDSLILPRIRLHYSDSDLNSFVHWDAPSSRGSGTEPLHDLAKPMKAVALVDSNHSPYDRDSLAFQAGDEIEILETHPSGIWRGRLGLREGTFKFISVKIIRTRKNCKLQVTQSLKKARSIQDILERLGLKTSSSVFLLHGYQDLSRAYSLDNDDLAFLGVLEEDKRQQILDILDALKYWEQEDPEELLMSP